MLEWARRAEAGPFSSLGLVDRVRFDCLEPLVLLAAVAVVTTRIELVTMVVIGPLRRNATLAREAATVHALSGGRLNLGVALGARADDYEATGVARRGRGARLEDQLAHLRDAFEDDLNDGGPDVLVGGGSDISFMRAARHADGYVHGGGPPRAFARAARSARVAWSESGRPGRPKLWAQGYFALGDSEVIERGRSYMRDYYAFTGPFVERITEGLLTTPQGVVQFIRGYAEAGCDELVLLPAVADIDQIDRLAEIVSG